MTSDDGRLELERRARELGDAAGAHDAVEQLVEVAATSPAALSPGQMCSGFAAPCACCSDVRSGSCGESTSGPNMSRSSLMRNWCSSDCTRARFTMMPSGWSRGERPRRISSIARSARSAAATENRPGSVTTATRSLAAHAVRVSALSDGAQSMSTRS